MSPRPAIFISAVSSELRSARQLVASTLTFLGYDPEWQDILGICFFEREERANKNQKQNTVTFQRGAEASSSLKRNKWGAARREDPLYAGFELELAGAERP
jgi:hypothetical protein